MGDPGSGGTDTCGSLVRGMREALTRLDGVAIGIDDSRVPLTLVEGIDTVDFTNASLLRELSERQIETAQADSIIEARGCSADLAEPLGLSAGDPVLAMRQVHEDHSGRTVLITMITYRGDRYRLCTTFARVPGPRFA